MEQKKNVYEKLAEARVMLQNKKLKKTGYNKYGGFSYFELSDFLPSVNEIFAQLKLCSQFSLTKEIYDDNATNDVAKLFVINTEEPSDVLLFSSPVAEANMKGAVAIQQLGAMHTYMRRYLWLIAMEICENDEIDATSGKQPETAPKQPTGTVERKASPKQIEVISKVYSGDNLKKLLDSNNVSKIEELSMNKASEIIKILKEKGNIQHEKSDSNLQS